MRYVRRELEAVLRQSAGGGDALVGSFLQTYLERDVRAISAVRYLATFRRLPTDDLPPPLSQIRYRILTQLPGFGRNAIDSP